MDVLSLFRAVRNQEILGLRAAAFRGLAQAMGGTNPLFFIPHSRPTFALFVVNVELLQPTTLIARRWADGAIEY